MSDNIKNTNQGASPIVQANQTYSQGEPVMPVGSVNKETGPVGASVSEFVRPTEGEPQISRELNDLGVEVRKEEPNIADEHRGLIEHAGQFIPAPTSVSDKVSLPMSEEEVEKQLKTGRDDDSGRWLAKLIAKVIAVMGVKI